MEVLLAFITDDFEGSVWTMQEVGYALGKGIPVVSLKLESKDPPGFISDRQALRGSLADLESSAQDMFTILGEAVGRKDRIQTALVAAFVASRDFIEARDRFNAMQRLIEKLTDAEVSMIVDGYYRNNQLYRSEYLDNKNHRLVRFLDAATDEEFTIEGRTIKEVQRPAR
jgi:hypothetical protein